MTKNQALRLALEYVELVPDDRYNADHIDRDALITTIKTTLEAKDEPVAWMDATGFIYKIKPEPVWPEVQPLKPLYTTPSAQRQWSDDEFISEAKRRGFFVETTRQHVTDGNSCWCNPEIIYTDPEADASVIVHKEPQ